MVARRWAVFMLLLLAVSSAQAAPRIGVLTMQPGEIFFERFGHNALVVDDPGLPGPVSYNFGFFDPEEDGFITSFIRGKMEYRLVALPLEDDLAYYRQVGRGVDLQWLELTPEQASALAAALARNARPENARYRYDYFTDNCSTRVRDAIDAALGGALRRDLQGRSRGNTFRGDAVRLASPASWMWLGFDIGLGTAADRPNSLWEDAFVPMRLAESLRNVRLPDGRPLVQEELQLLPHRLPPEPAEAPRALWPWLLTGLVLATAAQWLAARSPRALARAALPLWLVCGLLGALMLFIWLGTAHRFGWNNQNLLLFNPLALLLLPAGWRVARGGTAGTWLVYGLAVLVALGGLALFLHLMPVSPQRNGPWIALLLPAHAGLWMAFRRVRRRQLRAAG